MTDVQRAQKTLRLRTQLSPAVILGNPASIFVKQLARDWRARGVSASIVTQRWDGPAEIEPGIPVVAAQDEFAPRRFAVGCARRVLRRCEALWTKVDRRRFERAMGAFTQEDFRPSIADAACDAIALAATANRLRPKFVFGQEAFSFGLATARCQAPRILFPWGGDIYLWGEASPWAFRGVKKALRDVNLVCPSSVVAAEHIVRRYGVPGERVRPVSWGVDLDRFSPASASRRADLLRSLGIPLGAAVVLNVRRFNPAWGCRRALEACLIAAEREPRLHAVMLGGPDVAPFVAEARQAIAARGLAERFTLFDQELPLDRVAELMSIADVAISLMRVPDMRSSSILQAAASGAALVLSEQREYREMEKLGLAAAIVPADDAAGAAQEILRYVRDPGRRGDAANANLQYVRLHEDHERQMDVLLDLIEGICERQAGGGRR